MTRRRSDPPSPGPTSGPPPPYLAGVRIVPDRVADYGVFPFDLPFVRDLDLAFRHAVTFFAGENGTGKSTLLEAIAALSRFPVSGGGRNELAAGHGPEEESPLARALRPSWRNRPIDGYFLRAEFHAHFASLLDARAADPGYGGDPYARYGGRSLHARSHGEAFLAILKERVEDGFYLLDEPESALSPQRQLALLALMAEAARNGAAQFIIATHSPILMTFPGADIVCFDGGRLQRVRLEDLSQYQITRGILENPGSYWKHLAPEDPGRSADPGEGGREP